MASVGVADRDPIEPLPVELRTAVARQLFERAGFRVSPAPDPIGRAPDPAGPDCPGPIG